MSKCKATAQQQTQPSVYTPLGIQSDLCVVALEQAALLMGPAFIYTLTVNASQVVWVRGFLHKMSADVKENPFAPYINLVADESLGRYEWYISDGQRSVGSPGCT